MREIKFRIWDSQNNIMYNDAIYIGGKNTGRIDFTVRVDSIDFVKSKPENTIVMQYTGLKDKDGKEIYEGDIVKWGGGQSKVEFSEGAFIVCGDYPLYMLMSENQIEPTKMKIVGNIWENPDLLEGK